MDPPHPAFGILVEAESFNNLGGWVVDSQFEEVMGSPYILAHGNGIPVADAKTSIQVSESGEYNVWVRAKDWVPGHHPGRFTLAVNDKALGVVFGANDQDWSWQSGGRVELLLGDNRLTLHDLTGFCGRCDAIFFTKEDARPPETVNDAHRAWRRGLRGLPQQPVDGGSYDVVVVGGGIPGVAATLTAARLGEKVALVQDRPYLGGNASLEIGLSPRGVKGPVIQALSKRHPSGDLHALNLLEAEPNATVFLEHTVYNAMSVGNSIVSIDARDARSGREIRISATTFIDCSGKTVLGLYSGAETLSGQESKAEYDESLAPINRNNMHHGNTVFFRTRMADSPIRFPHVPWATEVAKDYADLGGQLKEPGIENGPGPKVTPPGYVPDPKLAARMSLPMTHYWEYGQWLDPYVQAEHIRDHLLRAVYGTFSNVKTLAPGAYANLALDWVAFVPAQGEFRRYKGDHVLTENDIRDHKKFPDAVAKNSGAFCLHYPGNERYDFRLGHWIWDERDGMSYDVPFRCLYSTNISNLLMAGKHVSVTRVAGSNTKFMGNGGQHAIAAAASAHLCRKHCTTPRGIYEKHMEQLQNTVADVARREHSKL